MSDSEHTKEALVHTAVMSTRTPYVAIGGRLVLAGTLLGLLTLVTAAGVLAQDGGSGCQAGAAAQIAPDFQSLVQALGSRAGDPLDCERLDPSSPDPQQHTTTGLLYLRTSTNTPTFTDGTHHWALRGTRRLTWDGPGADPPSDAQTGFGIGTIARQFGIDLRFLDDNTNVLKALGLYGFVGITLVIFAINLRNPRFLVRTLGYFLASTVALCVLLHASIYYLAWRTNPVVVDAGYDCQQVSATPQEVDCTLNQTVNPLPLTITNGPGDPNEIDKSTLLYWTLTAGIVAFYVTFPQSVVNTCISTLLRPGLRKNALLLLARTFGIGLGFITLIITLTSTLSPYRSADWFMLLLACLAVVLILRQSLWKDIGAGIGSHVPGGGLIGGAVGAVGPSDDA